MPPVRESNLPKTIEWVLIASLLAVPVWQAIGWWAIVERPPVERPPTSTSSSRPVVELIEPGATIDPEILSLPHGEEGFVLFTSTICPFSEADVPFYRTVSEWMHNTTDGHFVVVSDEPLGIIHRWLSGHGISASRVVDGTSVSSLSALGVFGTPTVALIGDKGSVTDVWVGELAAAQEANLMTMLKSGLRGLMANLRDPPVVDGNFDSGAISEDVLVLDVRDRTEYRVSHDPASVNIPADELGIRARVEIDRAERVFVDCRFGLLSNCRQAARGLVLHGFAQVAVIPPR